MNVLRISLWGLISLHTQLLFVFPIFYFLPRGGYWEVLAFFMVILAFALNVMVTYLIGIFFVFGEEDIFSENVGLLGVWALLGFVFVPLTMNNLAYHWHYKDIKPQVIALDTNTIAKAGNFLKLEKARILEDYTQITDIYHTRSSGKSGTTRYKVHYKLCPIVPENWQEGQPITFFLAYNNDEYLERDFKLAYTIDRRITDKFGYNYRKIAQEIITKHSLSMVGKPVFLQMIDEQKLQRLGWWYCRLFYGLMVGVWIVLCVFAMLQPKSVANT